MIDHSGANTRLIPRARVTLPLRCERSALTPQSSGASRGG